MQPDMAYLIQVLPNGTLLPFIMDFPKLICLIWTWKYRVLPNSSTGSSTRSLITWQGQRG